MNNDATNDQENALNIQMEELFPFTYEAQSPLLPLQANQRKPFEGLTSLRTEQFIQRNAINFADETLDWALLPEVPYEEFAKEKASWDDSEKEQFQLALKRDPKLREKYKLLEEKGQNEWVKRMEEIGGVQKKQRRV